MRQELSRRRGGGGGGGGGRGCRRSWACRVRGSRLASPAAGPAAGQCGPIKRSNQPRVEDVALGLPGVLIGAVARPPHKELSRAATGGSRARRKERLDFVPRACRPARRRVIGRAPLQGRPLRRRRLGKCGPLSRARLGRALWVRRRRDDRERLRGTVEPGAHGGDARACLGSGGSDSRCLCGSKLGLGLVVGEIMDVRT